MLDDTTTRLSGQPIASGVRVFRVVSADEIDDVLANLRPEDEAEIAAWAEDTEAFKRVFARTLKESSRELTWSVYIAGDPVFIFGLSPTVAKTWSLWGLGTPQTKTILRPLLRWVRKEWIPYLYSRGDLDRVQVHVPLKSEHSWQWLLNVGMKLRASLGLFGVGGETFLLLDHTRHNFETDFIGTDSVHFSTDASTPDTPDEDQR